MTLLGTTTYPTHTLLDKYVHVSTFYRAPLLIRAAPNIHFGAE